MYQFEDKHDPLTTIRRRRPFRPVHKQLRLYFESGGQARACMEVARFNVQVEQAAEAYSSEIRFVLSELT